MQSRLHQLAAALFLVCVIKTSATVLYVDLNSTHATPPYTNWITAATNIQDAVDAANSNDLILVTNGVYSTGGRLGRGPGLTNRVALYKAVTLQSINGPAETVIKGYQVPGTTNGEGAVRCAYLTNGATIIGFTLTNGATLGNTGEAKTTQDGGGAYCESSLCVLSNCVLTGNAAYLWGGGVIDGTLRTCRLYGNSAGSGGGAYLAVLNNCALFNNSAVTRGGGAVRGTLNNCTLAGNTANEGGGIYGSSDGVLNNCIIYNNTATLGPNYSGTYNFRFSINYCCSIPLATNGFGNITNEPLFVNLAAGAFQLQSNSPCINAGNNAYVTSATDLEGNPRIVGGTADIGAYEFQNPASVISYAWLQQYGLPTDSSGDCIDTDHDGMSNWQEWVAGTDPTNPLSLLKMSVPAQTNNPPGRTLTWQSVSGKTYFLQRSANFIPQAPFSCLQSNIAGLAGTTTFTDTTATNARAYFYRVGVQ